MTDPIMKRAARREARRIREDFRMVKAGVPSADRAAAMRLAAEDGTSLPEVIRLCLRGYVERQPAVLAMIEQLRREQARPAAAAKPRSGFSGGEMEQIWAEIGDGGIDDGT